MGGDTLVHLAAMVAKLKMYPYFDVANYILMCVMVREDSSLREHSSDAPAFSRKHPLSCWVSSMLMCFASVILTNMLTGESPIAPFTNHRDLLTASIVWYIINYTPFDIGYKLCRFLPFKLAINCLKEVQRANKVHHGIAFAMKNYPGSYPIICLIAVIKGAGYYYMRVFERLVRGVWIPSSNEILTPTVATKASLCAGIAFILHELGYIRLHSQLLYLAVVAFFIIVRILYLLAGIHDPFHPFENLCCGVFFGGVVDAIKNVVVRENPKLEDGAVVKNLPNKAKEE
jgi:hypothetical protein